MREMFHRLARNARALTPAPPRRRPIQPTYGGRKMAEENHEIIAAVLAAGIMGNGKFALRVDADTAVDL